MACELVGAAGLDSPAKLNRSHIMRRRYNRELHSFEDIYPTVESGALLEGKGPERLQKLWDTVQTLQLYRF